MPCIFLLNCFVTFSHRALDLFFFFLCGEPGNHFASSVESFVGRGGACQNC